MYDSTKFSAIVMTYNESNQLVDCLQSLSQFGEILVYDMGSTDGSIEIARQYATVVRSIPRVEIVEKIWPQVVREAINDWIMLIDPDEVFPINILPELETLIRTQPRVGLVAIPWKYYFLGKPLNSTSWGMEHFKARIFHRDRVDLTGVLFDGIKIRPGYDKFIFPTKSGFVLKHYWVDNLSQLFSKHWRYIRNAGEARFRKGERYSLIRQWKESVRVLRKDLVDYRGLHDGVRGIFLSFFHSWFIFTCHFSLLIYQILKRARNG